MVSVVFETEESVAPNPVLTLILEASQPSQRPRRTESD